MRTEELKKGDRVITHDKAWNHTYHGVVLASGAKTIKIKYDDDLYDPQIHYHRKANLDNYYLTFRREDDK